MTNPLPFLTVWFLLEYFLLAASDSLLVFANSRISSSFNLWRDRDREGEREREREKKIQNEPNKGSQVKAWNYTPTLHFSYINLGFLSPLHLSLSLLNALCLSISLSSSIFNSIFHLIDRGMSQWMLISKYFDVKLACESKLLKCDLNMSEDISLS